MCHRVQRFCLKGSGGWTFVVNMSENCYNYIYLTMGISMTTFIIEFNLLILIVLTLALDKVVVSYLTKLGNFQIYAFPKYLPNRYLSVQHKLLKFN